MTNIDDPADVAPEGVDVARGIQNDDRSPPSRSIVSVTKATTDDVPKVVEPLLREYGGWVADHLGQDIGITFPDADLARHHEAFRDEIPRLLGQRGRLLVARLGDQPVGVGALKPIDDTTAEIKRMYVRPAAQGRGVGRAIFARLIQDASDEGYETVRLETLRFMTTARAMYRNFGFVQAAKFDGSETANSMLDHLTIAMELDLVAAAERTQSTPLLQPHLTT